MPFTIGAGFHFLGPTGEMIAPEIYFADAFNPNGEIYQTEEAQTWRTRESFSSDAIQVEAVQARETALPPGARAGDATELTLIGSASPAPEPTRSCSRPAPTSPSILTLCRV